MRYASGAIHGGTPLLKKSMEMKTSALIPQSVVDIDDNAISNIGIDGWTWPLAVYANDWSHHRSIWIRHDPGDIPVVRDGSCHGHVREDEQRDE